MNDIYSELMNAARENYDPADDYATEAAQDAEDSAKAKQRQIPLPREFFVGGNATFTVANPQGEHYTFKIRRPENDMPYFLSLLTGPENTTDYTYVGIVDPFNGAVRLTKKSQLKDDSRPVRVARWALKHVWTDGVLPVGYRIQHEGKCGCCGRALTVPESIDRGIGPECAAKMGL